MEIKHIGPRPQRANPGDAGYDLVSTTLTVIPPGGWAIISTGLRVAIEHGYVGMICSRSGLVLKHGVVVLNAPGIIDSGYRGEVGVILANFGDRAFDVAPGDRVAQLIITRIPPASWEEVDQLPETERGDGGFGSSGR